MRVLVVDDDPSLRRWTRKLLPRFDIEEASSVADALARSEVATYDAAFIDVCLGDASDRSGLELVRALRSRGFVGALVVVSGLVGADAGDHAALAAGADAFLVKAEYDGPTLRSTIERALASRTGVALGAEFAAPPHLRSTLAEYLDSAADEDAVHAERAYRLACFAKDALRGGAHAPGVLACSRLVDVTPETLRLYALVASRWSPPELYEILVLRRNAEGRRISISHLAELAKLPRPARERWLKHVFDESLTVRGLREGLRAPSETDSRLGGGRS